MSSLVRLRDVVAPGNVPQGTAGGQGTGMKAATDSGVRLNRAQETAVVGGREPSEHDDDGDDVSRDWTIVTEEEIEQDRPWFEQRRYGRDRGHGPREKTFTGHYHVDIGWGRWKLRVYEINWSISGQDPRRCGCGAQQKVRGRHEDCDMDGGGEESEDGDEDEVEKAEGVGTKDRGKMHEYEYSYRSADAGTPVEVTAEAEAVVEMQSRDGDGDGGEAGAGEVEDNREATDGGVERYLVLAEAPRDEPKESGSGHPRFS